MRHESYKMLLISFAIVSLMGCSVKSNYSSEGEQLCESICLTYSSTPIVGELSFGIYTESQSETLPTFYDTILLCTPLFYQITNICDDFLSKIENVHIEEEVFNSILSEAMDYNNYIVEKNIDLSEYIVTLKRIGPKKIKTLNSKLKYIKKEHEEIISRIAERQKFLYVLEIEQRVEYKKIIDILKKEETKRQQIIDEYEKTKEAWQK